MKVLYLIVLMTIINSIAISQNYRPTSQSNNSLKFNIFLAGVEYAEIYTTKRQEDRMINNPHSADVYLGVLKYLQAMKFNQVGFSSKFNNQLPSLCDKTVIHIDYDVRGNRIDNFTVTFFSCDREWWEFRSNSSIINNGFGNIDDKVYHRFKKMYGLTKPNFNETHKRELPIEISNWSEILLKEYYTNNSIDRIEGIYEGTIGEGVKSTERIGIIKENNEYRLIYLRGAFNFKDWKEGEIKAELIKTASPSLFKLKWRMANKSLNKTLYSSFEAGMMNVFDEDGNNRLYIKVYPTQSDDALISNNLKFSGSGFALSSDGYIVTNHHVVEDASRVLVRGIDGDFSKTYETEVVIVDKNNDLAIIKIKDPSFSGLKDIPYTFNSKIIDSGTSVYALGYPLRASMGDEVKVTDGIISSKTGFKGDITSYQISVPVQPGNSGGPLLSKNGNLVGIINAKHIEAENVSYAIKTSYLINLLDAMNIIPELPANNVIASKTLSEQVKFIKEFVYILEVY